MAASIPPEESYRTKDEMEEKINLAALQQCDPNITDILATASQVALYRFTTEWEKTETEGTLFVYSRSAVPYHGFIIMNRLSTENWTEPINKELEFQLHKPFLLYRTPKAIFGIWFYKSEDCRNVSMLMQSLTEKAKYIAEKKVRQRSMSESDGGWSTHGQVDILQMLNKAQNEYLESQGSDQIPQRTITQNIGQVLSSPVRPVPIKPESPVQVVPQSTKIRPMLNRSLSVQYSQQTADVNQGIHPVLQKLLSQPGEGAVPMPVNNIHTVESIEKLHGDQHSGTGSSQPISVETIEGRSKVEPEGKTPAPLKDFFAKLNISSVSQSETPADSGKEISTTIPVSTKSTDNKTTTTLTNKQISSGVTSGVPCGSGEVDINQALLASLKASNQQPRASAVPSLGQMAATSVGAGNALLLGLQQQANTDTKSGSAAPLLLAPSAFRPRASSDTPSSTKPVCNLPGQSSAGPTSSSLIAPIASSFPLMSQADKITLSSSSQMSRSHMDIKQPLLPILDVDKGQEVTTLTKNQFRDAFVHLLQTDSTFVDKLFTSYLKTAQRK